MTTSQKAEARSHIMAAVHDVAIDLQRLGFIDQRKSKPERNHRSADVGAEQPRCVGGQI